MLQNEFITVTLQQYMYFYKTGYIVWKAKDEKDYAIHVEKIKQIP